MHSSNSAGAMERATYEEDDAAGSAGETLALPCADESPDSQTTLLETLEAEILALRSENESLRGALDIAKETMLRMLNHNNELLASAISVLHDRPRKPFTDGNSRPAAVDITATGKRKIRDGSEAPIAAEYISAADLTEWL